MKTCRRHCLIIIFTLFQVSVIIASQCPELDRVAKMPGQPDVNFQQFAGYITVNEIQNKSFFYYFVEADENPSSKPLVLWLNGGPGCSSVGEGAFAEHGPFRPDNNVLIRNNYSWNKVANILYVDSPDGVGFSSSADNFRNTIYRDYAIALDNLNFLLRWFDKFSGYKNRDLYLSGQSYGGHYIPQLAQLVIHSPLRFNFKGILLVSPLLDLIPDTDAMTPYLWSHGLITDYSYRLLTYSCSMSEILIKFMTTKNFSPSCSYVMRQIEAEFESYNTKNLDIFDVTADVCSSIDQNQQQSEGGRDLCIESETKNYLNRKDVQKALHVAGAVNWTSCNINVVRKYAFQDIARSMIPTLISVARSNIRILVISGDQDGKIPFFSTRTIINNLVRHLRLYTTSAYSPWFHGKQIGGWMQIHGGNKIAFATVKGGGHKVPYTSPERALILFKAFLDGEYNLKTQETEP